MRTQREVITDDEHQLVLAHPVEFKQLEANPPATERGDDAIRIYGGHAMGVVIQLRAYGPTDNRRQGVKRRMIATANYINRDQCARLIERLQKLLPTLQE